MVGKSASIGSACRPRSFEKIGTPVAAANQANCDPISSNTGVSACRGARGATPQRNPARTEMVVRTNHDDSHKAQANQQPGGEVGQRAEENFALLDPL